jgi:hypothetical protein
MPQLMPPQIASPSIDCAVDAIPRRARPNLFQSLLISALLLITFTLATLLVFVCLRLQSVNASANQIMNGALPGVSQTAAYEALVREKCRLVLEHIIADNPIVMDSIQNRIDRVTQQIAQAEKSELERLTAGDESAIFNRCLHERQTFDATIPAILAFSRSGNNAKAMVIYYRDSRPAFDHLMDDIAQQRIDDQNLGSANSTQILSITSETQLTTVVATVIVIVGVIAALLLVVRFLMPALALLSYTFGGEKAPRTRPR